MKDSPSIIECIPNFSEGRDVSKIQSIKDAITSIPEVKVLHVDMGYDANRTVITFAGSPEAVEKAAFEAMKSAASIIDMREQHGTHPRLGSTDVMPIVPVAGVSEHEAVQLSYRLSQRVCDELSISIYNYEKSAKKNNRKRLELIRKGEYEGLEVKQQELGWIPDYNCSFNPKTGATVIGARSFLLAYNINLQTSDIGVSKVIAETIRESGKVVSGQSVKGMFEGVKAIGWNVPEYGVTQVSTNITDTLKVGMHDVFEAVKTLAREYGTEVVGSELIGLTPLGCILDSGAFYSGDNVLDEQKIESAINNLGLGSVVPFNPQERIIEFLL